MASHKKLNATITIGGAISGSLKTALGSTKGGLLQIGSAIREVDKRQKLLGKSIDVFGKIGKNVDSLRRSYSATVTEIDRLRQAQSRLIAVEERRVRIGATATKMRNIGGVATAAGAAISAPMFVGIKEAKHYETEKSRVRALGMGDEVNNETFKFAKDMKTFGTSQLDNLTLVRDALSVFGDIDDAKMAAPTLAKMKFGNAAMYGQEHGAENEAKFMDMMKVIELRGGTKGNTVAEKKISFDKQANMVQKVISATGGRVQASEWRNAMSTGGTAAKLMRDDAFYYQMEPLVQMMGGDKVGTGLSAAYSSLYQGRTTKRAAMNLDKYGLIGDHSKVKNDKVGQVSHIDPGALLGWKLFRESQYEWVKQVLIPALTKKGVTDQKEIVDVIASFVSNKKGADMLAAMVMQQQLIDKDEKKNRGAYDVDQINEEGKKTSAGKELEIGAKVADLKKNLGEKVLPLYAYGLELVTKAVIKFNDFTEKHPRLAKAMAVGVGVTGAALLVLGTLLIGTAAGMYVWGVAAAFAGGPLPLLTARIGAISEGLGIMRISMLSFNAAALMNPVGLVIAGIAVVVVGAVILIRKYWEPITAFFSGVFDGICTAMHPTIRTLGKLKTAFQWIVEKVKVVWNWFTNLIEPVHSTTEQLKSASDAGESFGKVIGIAFNVALTPMNLMVSALSWIIDNIDRPIEALKNLEFQGVIKGLTNAAGFTKPGEVSGDWDDNKNEPVPAKRPPKIGATKQPVSPNHDLGGNKSPPAPARLPPPAPILPPMASGRGGASGDWQDNRQYTFHVTQKPGEDGKALAERLHRDIKEQDAVRRRGALYDYAMGGA